MGDYFMALSGGGMPDSEEDQAKVMEAWTTWFGELGSSLSNPGNPLGESRVVRTDRSVTAGTAGMNGFLLITADSLDAAVEAAKGCPNMDSGGTVEVYEALPIPGM